ncbi:MAG: ParB/RepB/Spo0J family partition protein [Rhodospirillales bacterium]
MESRHKAVYDDVLNGLDAEAPTPETKPRPTPERAGSRFFNRSNALSERLSGDVVEQTLLWVAPERCRMWERHNRRYELLNEQRCADLIEGFKVQGRQEFPAVVRRLRDDPAHDYEVICGARRHWTVAWLRANNYRQYRFLIEVRDLSDEEAFRLGDIENRDRQDISDYERAMDYADAVTRYYQGRQKDMAARIEVSETWLSRYLGLAKLPKGIVEAYAGITEIREHHARELNPLLSHPEKRRLILDEAKIIAREQRAALQGEGRVIDGPVVVARLKAAVSPKRSPRRPPGAEYRSSTGEVLLSARRQKGGGVILQIPHVGDAEEVLAACRRALLDHSRRNT